MRRKDLSRFHGSYCPFHNVGSIKINKIYSILLLLLTELSLGTRKRRYRIVVLGHWAPLTRRVGNTDLLVIDRLIVSPEVLQYTPYNAIENAGVAIGYTSFFHCPPNLD